MAIDLNEFAIFAARTDMMIRQLANERDTLAKTIASLEKALAILNRVRNPDNERKEL